MTDKYQMISYMESNEQTELTSKIETFLQVQSRLTAMVGGRLRGGGIKQKGKDSCP